MTRCRSFWVFRRCALALRLAKLVAALFIVIAITLASQKIFQSGQPRREPSGIVGVRAAPAPGPLRVFPQNPRYFTDGSGKAVYLTGSHVWFNLKDMGTTDPPPIFDYEAYLAFLQLHNHNFIRMWTWELTKWSDGGSDPWFIDPFPWQRTGPGLALNGKPKFDLNLFDESYFDRLRSRVIAAGERGIYVSIMLFEGYALRFSHRDSGSTGHPFNINNNINGIHGDSDDDGKPTEIHSLQNPAVTALQKAYVSKVIDTVNDLDNVLYEIANESHSEARAWQYEMIHFVRNYEAQLPKQHPIGMTSDGGGGYDDTTDLFLSPADWISPSCDRDDYKNNPPAAIGDKVILLDTDHLWGIGGNRAWVWKSFLRGLNPIFMDGTPPLYHGFVLPEGGEIRVAMGDTLKHAERIDLAAMAPHGELASTGYCLSSPGYEYLVYLPSGGSVTVNLTEASGSFAVEWFNPSTAVTTHGRTTTGGESRSFSAPFDGDAVLYIYPSDPALSVFSVQPDSGPTQGNTKIRIFGKNFRSGALVRIGGLPLSEVRLVNKGELVGITPLHEGGAVDVEVIQPDGTGKVLSSGYRYELFPKLSLPPEGSGIKLLRVPFVADSNQVRTNLGINNVSGEVAPVRVSLVDNNGLLLFQKDVAVPPHGLSQINNVLQFLEGSATVRGREGYLALESPSNLLAWVSQIDKVSGDPNIQRGTSSAASRLLLPSSVANSKFSTSLFVINPNARDGKVNIVGRNTTGDVQFSLTEVPIPGNGSVFFEDLYARAGLKNVFGPIYLEGVDGLPIVAAGRIFSREHTGAYLDGISLESVSRKAVLPYSIDSSDYRTNLGINNLGTGTAQVTISLIDKTGAVLGSIRTTVDVNGLRQIDNVNRLILGAAAVTNVEGWLSIDSDQDVVSWTSQIDNFSQDPSLSVAKSTTGGAKLLVPSVTNFGAFKSSLVVVNRGSQVETVELKFRTSAGNIGATKVETVPAGGLFFSSDILGNLGLAESFGSLEIVALGNSPIVAVSHVKGEQHTGGFFEAAPQ